MRHYTAHLKVLEERGSFLVSECKECSSLHLVSFLSRCLLVSPGHLSFLQKRHQTLCFRAWEVVVTLSEIWSRHKSDIICSNLRGPEAAKITAPWLLSPFPLPPTQLAHFPSHLTHHRRPSKPPPLNLLLHICTFLLLSLSIIHFLPYH